MATMGKYCKAYPVEAFRAYPLWKETPIDPRKTEAEDDDPDAVSESRLYYFLHENYVVAAGVFKDEQIVFSEVTPEWIEFCTGTLAFKIPDYVPKTVEAVAQAAAPA